MKLYHATSENNLESIENFGIIAQHSFKPGEDEYNRNVVSEGEVVYGFDNIEDAISFGYDNADHIIVCVFDVDDEEVSTDKEYEDGNAFTVKHDINAEDIEILDEDKLSDMGMI